jgi:hypothetical protein
MLQKHKKKTGGKTDLLLSDCMKNTNKNFLATALVLGYITIYFIA